jgi:2-polyprenyl-3-methyl-5-hydroxy-6-metoxy-1,4-benzoquinol methylase
MRFRYAGPHRDDRHRDRIRADDQPAHSCCTDHLASEHLARYRWACTFLPRKRVLDCSCGPGYGTAMLADRGAEQVIGVDIDAGAIESARSRYARPNVEYREADALRMSAEKMGRFDLIVSLETIEHLAEPQRLLDVFAGLLTDEGQLLLSCPNDAVLGTGNPFHL